MGDPEPTLRWLEHSSSARLDALSSSQAWGLVAMAAMARKERPRPLRVVSEGGPVSSFAHAVGFESVTHGRPIHAAPESERSVRLRRFRGHLESLANAGLVAKLVVKDPAYDETRLTITYVLTELLRNVVQHSGDELGGVMAAQLTRAGKAGYSRDTIQVAVADNGMGVPRSLSGHHPEAVDPQVALERALWPHVSGAFPSGQSGSADNAGLGLFFISEMAKRTAGRLLIASRGASILLVGSEDPEEGASLRIFDAGFDGTLVVFELALDEVRDHDALIRRIQDLALQRSPQRISHRWLTHGDPPAGVPVHAIAPFAENTEKALQFARDHLEPRIVQRQPVALDFAGVRICTQSFTHALLFEALRLAWARRTNIHIVRASPAVVSSLRLLENYALGG